MYDMVAQFADQLEVGERLALIAHLKSTIAEELAGSPEGPARCPHCGCPRFVKRGFHGGYRASSSAS